MSILSYNGVVLNYAGNILNFENTTPPTPNNPLDLYPGASAAYSVSRRLSDGYNDAFLLRNSSNATVVIQYLNTLVDEAAMVDHCAGGPGWVVELYDSSGNGLTCSNANAASQPKIVDDSGAVIKVNGRVSMLFEDDTRMLRASTASDWKYLSDGTEWSAYIVAKFGNEASPSATYPVFGTNTNGTTGETGAFLSWVNDAFNTNSIRSAVTDSSGLPSTIPINNYSQNNYASPNVLCLSSMLSKPLNIVAANRSELYINSKAVQKNNLVTGDINNVNPANALQIGGFGDYPNFVGHISELIFYPFI